MTDPAVGSEELRTHLAIERRWSGRPVALEKGRARVVLETVPEMSADEEGLVHGGFVFSLADHAAMLAVNEPTVVLAAADVRFLAPSRVGETLVAEATLSSADGKRRSVEVEVRASRASGPVFTGTFSCVVPSRHVLEGR